MAQAMTTIDYSNEVRRLNDRFRARVELDDQVMVSPRVKNLPKIVKSAILKEIKNYDGFESDFVEEIVNHDFGLFSLGGYDIFWEIKNLSE